VCKILDELPREPTSDKLVPRSLSVGSRLPIPGAAARITTSIGYSALVSLSHDLSCWARLTWNTRVVQLRKLSSSEAFTRPFNIGSDNASKKLRYILNSTIGWTISRRQVIVEKFSAVSPWVTSETFGSSLKLLLRFVSAKRFKEKKKIKIHLNSRIQWAGVFILVFRWFESER
jgi:hypothetical protein